MNWTRRAVLAAGVAMAGGMLPAWARRHDGPTPPGVEGPFYPAEWPRTPANLSGPDDDADLVWIQGQTSYAEGTILLLGGRVLDALGNSQPNIDVEIWQVDARGRYHHPDDANPAVLDPLFRGRGHALTDADGVYRFRTIRPVPYPGRTPHIHFKLKTTCAANLLTTQMYIAGEPRNASDFIYQAVRAEQRDRVTVRLRKARPVILRGARRAVERATFDIVLGETPCAPAAPAGRS